ncbi:peptidase inhibitor family I36 protein [Streptomyces sp. NPDC000070]|uniref:peptidase inhibitor family I36 protein n=1 Tax=Streptomyces sp. NPDC000070 TaxID=3154240 RepID=UPI00331D482F
MTVKRTAKRIGTGVAALALAGTAFSGSAHAAASDCPSGWLCVWSGTQYSGWMQKVQYNNADLSQFTVFATDTDSIYNNGESCDVQLYGGKNYTNLIGTLERGRKLSSGGTSLKILSNKWVNCS